ncbi:hypothetical protein MD484_g5328, partial [Candolleomyces efflorescens]
MYQLRPPTTSASISLSASQAVFTGTGSICARKQKGMTSLTQARQQKLLVAAWIQSSSSKGHTARQTKAAAQCANSSADIVLLASVRDGGKLSVHMRRSITIYKRGSASLLSFLYLHDVLRGSLFLRLRVLLVSSLLFDTMSIPHATTFSEKPMSTSSSQQGYKLHPPPSLHDLPSKETSNHQSDYYDSELGHPTHHGACPHRRQACRSRRYLVPMIIGIIVSLIAFGLLSCTNTGLDLDAWLASLTPGGADLVRRAAETTAATSTEGTGNPIIDKKYYLIIIFVGLVLVIFAGIMLSAWCCKGAFKNPLCCPCYLCACCGGLACLECIGCGLCAEGFEQLSQDG